MLQLFCKIIGWVKIDERGLVRLLINGDFMKRMGKENYSFGQRVCKKFRKVRGVKTIKSNLRDK